MGCDKIGSKLKYCHGSDKKIGLNFFFFWEGNRVEVEA